MQPAAAGAVKSALFKDRERSTVKFANGRYELVEGKKKTPVASSAAGV